MDFQELFLASLRRSPLAQRLALSGEASISRYMDLCPIQDSFRFRARYLGSVLANDLIDEKGELNRTRLEEWAALFERGTYLLGPEREGDFLIFSHLKGAVQYLREKGEIWTWVKKFSPPLANKRAEELIRNTLWPEQIRTVQTPQIRKAVLAAWFTLLRQTTGSCFATAPAIMIQKNYPLRLIKDLYDLLSTGRMKRIVGGKEYSVPLSPNLGKTDLQRPLGPYSETLHYSPGLILALEAGGLLAPEKTLDKKISELHRMLEGRDLAQNAEKLIRGWLLESLELTEQDLEDEEHLSRIQMSPLLAKQSAVYYQKPSERAQKISEWKKRLAKASHAFEAVAECALLRAWEYSMASFCDVKVDFARWNLYVGLGLDSNQKGGVGSYLYQAIDQKLQQANEEAARLHQEYEQSLGAARAAEAMIYNALSDGQRNHLKAEWSSSMQAANAALEMRNRAAEKAEAIANFFPYLIQQYDQKLQDGFQELFDPSLVGEESHLYEDSPAGFRLVYKHGRADSSQWTSICNGDQYADALRDFFSAVERDLQPPPQIGQEFVTELTTGLIQYIREPEFLEAASARSKEKGRLSPWHYISGGTMETLLQAYCNRDRPFAEVSFVPKSERDVLEFVLKIENPDPHLIHSPTHAFVLLPSLLKKESGLVEKNLQWCQAQGKVNEALAEHLSHRLSERLPGKEKALFLHLFRQMPTPASMRQLREYWIGALQAIKGSFVKDPASLVDSFLFEQVPVLTSQKSKEAVGLIWERLSRKYPFVRAAANGLEGDFISASERMDFCKKQLLQILPEPFSPIDWDLEIAIAARQTGSAYPEPLLFADTNWSGWFLGFVVNVSSGALELWRLNRIGTKGVPMSDWKRWMHPKNEDSWILLSRPNEYTEAFV